MKFIDTYPEEKIIKLTEYIAKEAVSWRCIYLHPSDDLPKFIDRLSLELKVLLKDVYTSYFVAMPNHEVFFLCKGGDAHLMNVILKMVEEITTDEDAEIQTTLYDLSCDFDDLQNLVAKYKEEEPEAPLSQTEQKPEVKALVAETTDPQIISQLNQTRLSSDRMTVMLVDDEPMTLRMVESILKGCRVLKCDNPQKALDRYLVDAPHIVFLDINMPPYSGHDFLKELTKIDPDAFVVMLSANSYPEDIKKVMQAGAKGFVGKPFSKAKIHSYLMAYEKLTGRKFL